MATVTVTPSKVFIDGESVTSSKLNSLGTPLVSVGQIGTSDIALGAITYPLLDSGAVNTILNIIYPVGSIYISLTNSPPVYGSWERVSEGTVLIGYDDSDTDFSNVTGSQGGGNKTISVDPHTHDVSYSSEEGVITQSDGVDEYIQPSGGFIANIMNPYTVVYMFRRVASASDGVTTGGGSNEIITNPPPTPPTPPAAPVITNISETSNDGNSNDFITDDNSPLIDVQAEADGLLKVYFNNDQSVASNLYTVTEVTAGNYQIDFADNTLPNGQYKVTVTNTTTQLQSGFSNLFTINFQSTIAGNPPAKPIITNVAGSSNDPNPNDLISDTSFPVLTIAGESGATLTVNNQGGALAAGSYNYTENNGIYTVEFETELPDGQYIVFLENQYGTSSASEIFEVNTTTTSTPSGTYTYNISQNSYGVDLWNAIVNSNGGTPPSEGSIVVNIQAGVEIGAVDNSRGFNHALRITDGFALAQKSLTINNYGNIIGFGGSGGGYDSSGIDIYGQNGGSAVMISSPLTFNNYGLVAGGGGGGGGSAGYAQNTDGYVLYGNGGGGAGIPPGPAGINEDSGYAISGAFQLGASPATKLIGGIALTDGILSDRGGDGGSLGEPGIDTEDFNWQFDTAGNAGFAYFISGIQQTAVEWNNYQNGTTIGPIN